MPASRCLAAHRLSSGRTLGGWSARILRSRDPLPQPPQRPPPPIRHPPQSRLLRKPMPRSMPPGNRVPRTVLDRNPCFVTHRLERNLNFSGLFRRETRLPPGKHQPPPGLPNRHPPDLKGRAVVECRVEPSANTRLKRQPTIPARANTKQSARLPPKRDLLGEHLKRPHWIGRNAQSNEDLRDHNRTSLASCRIRPSRPPNASTTSRERTAKIAEPQWLLPHFRPFARCAFNASSCRPHSASVSSNHTRKSAIGSGLKR